MKGPLGKICRRQQAFQNNMGEAFGTHPRHYPNYLWYDLYREYASMCPTKAASFIKRQSDQFNLELDIAKLMARRVTYSACILFNVFHSLIHLRVSTDG